MSILAQFEPEARRLPHTSVARAHFPKIATNGSTNARNTHAGRMTYFDATQSQSNLADYLATLARVRALCERIVASIPVPADTFEWQGGAQRVFVDNMLSLRMRAHTCVLRINDAEHTVRGYESTLSAGLSDG